MVVYVMRTVESAVNRVRGGRACGWDNHAQSSSCMISAIGGRGRQIIRRVAVTCNDATRQ